MFIEFSGQVYTMFRALVVSGMEFRGWWWWWLGWWWCGGNSGVAERGLKDF